MEKKLRTYKHNNEELLSGESERILHKNAKNYRIKQAEAKRSEIIGDVILVLAFVGFMAFIIVGGLMTRI